MTSCRILPIGTLVLGLAGCGGAGTGGGAAEGTGGLDGSGGPPGCEYDQLADACLLPIACDEAAIPFGGGEGTAELPYRLCSFAHLQAMDDVATGDGKHFVLARSLDLSDVVGFVPLENEDGKFFGTLDGAGHALVGLTIDLPEEGDVGLFAHLKWESEVRHLKLYDFNIRGYADVGTLAGYSGARVLDVHASGRVEAINDLAGGLFGVNIGAIESSSATADVVGVDSVGGLVGLSEGSFLDCEASGTVTGAYTLGGLVGASWSTGVISDSRSSVTVRGEGTVGGLVGYNEGEITACEASGNVFATGLAGGLVGAADEGLIRTSRATGTVEGGRTVGGLIGDLNGSMVEDCEATGAVTSGDERVGGLIGFAGFGTITRSRAAGLVTGRLSVGGLAGATWEMTIEESTATGHVVGTLGYAGGLVGEGDGFSVVRTSYATGDVTGYGLAAGLIGGISTITEVDPGGVDECYSLGLVSGATDPAAFVRGFIGGEDPGIVTDSYSREQGLAAGAGMALTLGAFADQASFVGWDFASTWTMSAELGRPVLSWE